MIRELRRLGSPRPSREIGCCARASKRVHWADLPAQSDQYVRISRTSCKMKRQRCAHPKTGKQARPSAASTNVLPSDRSRRTRPHRRRSGSSPFFRLVVARARPADAVLRRFYEGAALHAACAHTQQAPRPLNGGTRCTYARLWIRSRARRH